MQSLSCPNCRHQSAYDPWVEPAHCPRCGYTPPKNLLGRPGLSKRAGTYRSFLDQPFLEELLSRWKGTHPPDSSFTLPTSELRLGFFHAYQRALGEAPDLGPGHHGSYIRSYHPRL